MPLYSGAEEASQLVNENLEEILPSTAEIEAYEVDTDIETVSDWYVKELNETGWTNKENTKESDDGWVGTFRKDNEGAIIIIEGPQAIESDFSELTTTTIFLVKGSWENISKLG